MGENKTLILFRLKAWININKQQSRVGSVIRESMHSKGYSNSCPSSCDAIQPSHPVIPLKAGGKEDDRGWGGWMSSTTGWTWVPVSSRSWWWTGKPGVLQSMGSQRVGHDWATDPNWNGGSLPRLVLGPKGHLKSNAKPHPLKNTLFRRY